MVKKCKDRYEVVNIQHFQVEIDGKMVTRKRVMMKPVEIHYTTGSIKTKKPEKKKKEITFISLFD
tara:strand:+ start:1178 stop:1372 length:195 start_codon:yes stop_codon:yes gene_type:complete